MWHYVTMTSRHDDEISVNNVIKQVIYDQIIYDQDENAGVYKNNLSVRPTVIHKY